MMPARDAKRRNESTLRAGSAMPVTSKGSAGLRITEEQFQQQIIDTARLLGWRVYHTRDSRRSEPGFPDLVLCRDRLVFLEIKTETGRVSDAQGEWIAAINRAGGCALVVRPSDLAEIEKALKRRVHPQAESEAA
jgi:hypothetical protein